GDTCVHTPSMARCRSPWQWREFGLWTIGHSCAQGPESRAAHRPRSPRRRIDNAAPCVDEHCTPAQNGRTAGRARAHLSVRVKNVSLEARSSASAMSEPKNLAKGSEDVSHPLIARTLVDAHTGSCAEVEAFRRPVDRHGHGRMAQLQIASAHAPSFVAEHPGGPGGQVEAGVPGMVQVMGDRKSTRL